MMASIQTSSPDIGARPVSAATGIDARNMNFAVHLEQVTKSFGSVTALRNANMSLREGTFTSLLGPSGCGKTTLLRLIAGLETASSGEIQIKGRSVGGIPIHKRNIGLVFQNYALFPHKTVGDNIAFGLKHRGIDKISIGHKIKKALDIVRLPGIEERYPNQLSGGQQQRVALARAVVFEPDVLLLDEPLSALDANLREDMRVEIKLIQKALGVTTIMVTHDQQEALAMSDEVVVMNQGTIQQVGDPKSVYRFPRNRFVAGFLGQANVFDCEIVGRAPDQRGFWRVRLGNGKEINATSSGPHYDELSVGHGSKVALVIRGSEISTTATMEGSDSVNGLAGVVVDSSYLGDDVHYLIDVSGIQIKAVSRLSGGQGRDATQIFAPGTAVFAAIPAEACGILPAA